MINNILQTEKGEAGWSGGRETEERNRGGGRRKEDEEGRKVD